MVDCHMHMVLDGVYWRSAIARHCPVPDKKWIQNTLQEYQKHGYTYLRDGGDRWGVSFAARAMAPACGIVYRTPGAPLCKAGHYGSFIGATYENFKEYASLVVEARQTGADFIKIMISGLMDFDRYEVLTEPGLDPAEIRELIHIAHQEGMSVMAHANGARTVEAAAAAGVESVEHGAYLDADALAAMAENETVWVPTVSTVANLRGQGRFSEKAVQQILESAMENVACYTGYLAPGSDAGAWAVPHGGQKEYDLLLQAGVTEQRLKQGIARIQALF